MRTTVLMACVVTFVSVTSTVPSRAEPDACRPLPDTCHDRVWGATEWCGRDCLVDVGSTDMTHDCEVELIDFGIFAPQYGVTACGLSADLDGDCNVGNDDFATFVAHYGEHVSPCTTADSPEHGEPSGGLYLSFTPDPNDINGYLEYQPMGHISLFVVADEVASLSSLEFGVTSTHPGGFTPGFEPAFPFNLHLENGPEEVTAGAVYSTGGPVIVGRFEYLYLGQPQVDFRVVPNSGSGNLRWGSWTEYQYHDFLLTRSASIFDRAASTAVDDTSGPHAAFRVDQNHPNPFTSSTSLRFSLPTASRVRLAVYDAAGARVAVLKDEYLDRGEFTAAWDGRNDEDHPVGPGFYFVRVEAGRFRAMKKMILLR